MNIFALVIALGWIGFIIYWVVSAFGSKPDTTPKTWGFFGPRMALIIMAAVLTLVFNHLPEPLRNSLLAANNAALVAGLVIFVLGIAVAVWARVHLGRDWGMPMTQRQDPELVTSGPYRFIRHPIYTGVLLMMLGSAIDVNSYWLLVLLVSAAYFTYSAISEEKLMLRQFPKTYPAYRSKTKMLVPFVF